MARITSPICRKCRREGKKLFLKGERCQSVKCAFVRRSYAPGFHGLSRHSRLSNYGQQLREKQKAKAIYGVLERQFKNYYEKSTKSGGKESMLTLIERRFDNVVHRLGFAPSRRAARQMITHGLLKINGKKVDIASYLVKIGDKVSLKNSEKSKDLDNKIKENIKRNIPVSWLKMDIEKMTGEVTSLPKKEDVGDEINERLIIEYYSR